LPHTTIDMPLVDTPLRCLRNPDRVSGESAEREYWNKNRNENQADEQTVAAANLEPNFLD